MRPPPSTSLLDFSILKRIFNCTVYWQPEGYLIASAPVIYPLFLLFILLCQHEVFVSLLSDGLIALELTT